MTSDPIELTLLAARAKTRIKRRGTQGISETSVQEIMALAFIADLFLADYTGPMERGAANYDPHPHNTELETL